ncbi:MAG: CBS domain-containing protein [candidate division Zixibacteria bacterium]|nr:CBS domain-containing protein [candidate division Zixibacteria bacterium]MBU1469118.1 CBS domain-containing protein [candidate division Zixibacteria bacterium]MBU2624881.1 CBS domain-containing protein [candidate division Zixibacteria bacterium]
MLVRDIIEKKGFKIVSVAPDDSLAGAIKIMMENFVGSALVIDKAGEVAGMLTERDILRFCSRIGGSLTESKVSAIMSTDLIVALVGDDVETMIATMVENRFRHLPVLDEGQLVGLVSMGDLVKSQLKEEKGENRHLKDYIAGKYPA